MPGSATTTMQKVLKEEPLPPSTLNVQLPPAMDAVVRKALAKRADDRFQTAQEFADAIRAAASATTAPVAAASAGWQFRSDDLVGTRRDAAKDAALVNLQAAQFPATATAPTKRVEARARDRRRSCRHCGRRRRMVRLPAASDGYRKRPRRRRGTSAPGRPRLTPRSRDGSAKTRTRNADDLRGRTDRPERSALPERQGLAAKRPARRFQEPTGREGGGPLASTRTRSPRITTCSRIGCCRRAAASSRP